MAVRTKTSGRKENAARLITISIQLPPMPRFLWRYLPAWIVGEQPSRQKVHPARLITVPFRLLLTPRFVRRYLPAWIILAAVLVISMPSLLTATNRFVNSIRDLFAPHGIIAPLFTREVRHWSGDIQRWAAEYHLDPNLLATVMQIESCGHPTVSSYAGAQGLFQVMPFHFSPEENQLDPETNGKHGADVLQQCLLNFANGDPGLAMACYNGGPSVVSKPYTAWSAQTQRYYIWGMGIYTDASSNQSQSTTLDLWLDAGGKILCQQADAALGL